MRKTPVYVLYGVILAFFAAFLVYPMLYLIKAGLWLGGRFDPIFIQLVWINPISREHLLNSFLIGLCTVLATSAAALPLAFLTVRYRFVGRQLFQGLLLASIVLPPFVSAIGLKQLFAQYGAFTLLMHRLGLADGPIDWLGRGIWGVIFLETLHLYPILYLNITAALANIDPAQEEAALSVGASPWRTFRTITLPLLAPGYFAGAIIVFIWAFTDLGVPLILNFGGVLPMRIFHALQDINVNPVGYAMVIWVLGIALLAFFVARLFLGRKHFATLGRGNSRSRERSIGHHGWWIYPLLTVLLLVSLLPQFGVALTSLADNWFMSIVPETSLDHYRTLFDNPLVGLSVRNTLIYSLWGMALNLLLGFVVAYFLVRLRLPFSSLLDAMVMAPLAIPGIVLAFGLLTGFSGTWLDARENPAALISIAYAIRHFPFIVRTAAAGLQQVPVSLEEAAWNLGTPPARTLWLITAPLIRANIVAGALLAFVLSIMEVSSGLILALREPTYPIAKLMYAISGRVVDGPQVAAALGILGMALVIGGLLIASRLLGRSLGVLFRAA